MESKDIASLAVLAGEELLKSGAETYRVEETMERIALACGAKRAESLVLHTGLVLEVEAADAPLLGHLLAVAARLAREHGLTAGYKTQINTGHAGGQEVFHLHIHVLGQPQ